MADENIGGVYLLTFDDGSWFVGRTDQIASNEFQLRTDFNRGLTSSVLIDAWVRNNRTYPSFEIIYYGNDEVKQSRVISGYVSDRIQYDHLKCLNDSNIKTDGEESDQSILSSIKRRIILNKLEETVAEIDHLTFKVRELTEELANS